MHKGKKKERKSSTKYINVGVVCSTPHWNVNFYIIYKAVYSTPWISDGTMHNNIQA
jgi:hypothetical protein